MRRISSRLSVAASLIAMLAGTQACGGGGDSGGGGGDDTGSPITDGGGDTSTGDGGGDSKGDGSGDTGGGGDGSDTGGGTDTGGGGDTSTDGGGCTIASCGPDSDCDGIDDTIEGRFSTPSVDTDADGTADYLDLDADGDTIPDKVEWITAGCDSPFAEKNDADGDGVPNFQSLDSDGNGLPDKDEACPPAGMPGAPSGCAPATPADFDGDGWMDFIDFDNDHDSINSDKSIGLDDKTELADNSKTYVGLTLDTDTDGIPDVFDRDADGDFIYDLEDGTTDPNGNSVPNFRDLDSDGDAVPDACEARAHAAPVASDLDTALLDTDGDGILDYVDLDTDSDYLADKKEDLNGNCVVDTGETDRLKADTDGDGVPDLPEVALESPACAVDPTCSPTKSGKFYFIVPYSTDGSSKPTPTDGTLALATNLQKGDVGFVVDTTISMEGEIAALKTDLSTKIIPALAAKFTDLGIGVAAHDDFPSSSIGNIPIGTADPRPFYVASKTSPTGYINTDPTVAQTAANSLTTTSGGSADIPESQVGAMMRALDASVVLKNTDTKVFTLVAETPPAGTNGSLHFRSDALQIVVPITDAGFHNGKRALTAPPTGAAGDYDAATVNNYDATKVTSPGIDALVSTITALGAKVIGIASDDGGRSTALNAPYGFLAYLSDKTGSYAPKSAFGGVPPTCKTNIGGASTSADGPSIAGVPSCRLVFSINTDGTGLSNSIITGVGALLNAISFDVHVRAYKEPTDAIDAVDAFIQDLPPQPGGGTDPVTGGVCVTFSASTLADRYTGPKAVTGPDGENETITGLNPGKLYCFKVVPKPNTTVPATVDPQTFTAWVSVIGDKIGGGGSVTLGKDRQVLFIVPPRLN
jgi:hypothetical protein